MQYEATVPDVIDRVVQEAVRQVLEPLWEPTFHPSSHGFRPGRSCHTAIAEAKTHVEDGYEWCVDLDLEKFFDLVCHQRLAAKLAERVSDRRLLGLIGRMLKAKVVLPDGVVIDSEQGVPQGGPLSPLLSNVVLDEFDQELARRGHRFVRYADDAKVYVRSERAGQRVMVSLTEFIQGRLRLRVNEAKSAVARPEDRHFLGFRLRLDPQTGVVEVLLSERTKRNAMARVRQLTPRNWGCSLADCIAPINAWLGGWHGFFGIASVEEMQMMRKIDAHIRRRLRAIILRHWKRKRYRGSLNKELPCTKELVIEIDHTRSDSLRDRRTVLGCRRRALAICNPRALLAPPHTRVVLLHLLHIRACDRPRQDVLADEKFGKGLATVDTTTRGPHYRLYDTLAQHSAMARCLVYCDRASGSHGDKLGD